MIRYHTTWAVMCQFVMYSGIFVAGCSNPVDRMHDLSGYYYPVDDLPTGGMRYTYKNLVDTLGDKEVWRHLKKGDHLLESINYDSRGEVVQRQYDRIVSNGVITDSLVLFSKDSLGRKSRILVKMNTPFRFPFEPGDSTKVWLSAMEWWQPEDSLHVVLERRRIFLGDTIWHHEGKSIPAVRFRTQDKFETERDGWTTSAWSGEEIYAWHIGLVYYKRKISENLSLAFELESRR